MRVLAEMEKIARVDSLQEIIAAMTESTDTSDRRSGDRSPGTVLAATDIQRDLRPAD